MIDEHRTSMLMFVYGDARQPHPESIQKIIAFLNAFI